MSFINRLIGGLGGVVGSRLTVAQTPQDKAVDKLLTECKGLEKAIPASIGLRKAGCVLRFTPLTCFLGGIMMHQAGKKGAIECYEKASEKIAQIDVLLACKTPGGKQGISKEKRAELVKARDSLHGFVFARETSKMKGRELDNYEAGHAFTQRARDNLALASTPKAQKLPLDKKEQKGLEKTDSFITKAMEMTGCTKEEVLAAIGEARTEGENRDGKFETEQQITGRKPPRKADSRETTGVDKKKESGNNEPFVLVFISEEDAKKQNLR